MAVLLLAAVLGVGVISLRLHTLLERVAHKSQKLQFEVVAILGQLALFTHIHLFWVGRLRFMPSTRSAWFTPCCYAFRR